MAKLNEKDKAAAASGLTSGVVKRSDIFGESSGGAGLDDAKVREAVKKQEEWHRQDHSLEADDRKRGYNSTTAIDVTAEDMEAYRIKKAKRDDPMAAFADSEELLEYDGGSGGAGRKR